MTWMAGTSRCGRNPTDVAPHSHRGHICIAYIPFSEMTICRCVTCVMWITCDNRSIRLGWRLMFAHLKQSWSSTVQHAAEPCWWYESGYKGDLLCFLFFLPFSVLYTLLCMLNIFQVTKVKVSTNRELLSPTKKTAPETPRQWSHLWFSDITLYHHVTNLHNVFLVVYFVT